MNEALGKVHESCRVSFFMKLETFQKEKQRATDPVLTSLRPDDSLKDTLSQHFSHAHDSVYEGSKKRQKQKLEKLIGKNLMLKCRTVHD